ncbi:MAG: PDZ domain-containing protein [Synergistaceae bacterium]|jgi:hypothetical protein|nr:PDZ domain-containing protein [Synergistaceae bacterium]
MKKNDAISFITFMFLLLSVSRSEAVPKSIALRTPDRDGVLGYIVQSMAIQGFRMTVSDPYRLVFEKKASDLFESAVYRDPWVFKNPVFRKTWSVIPSPDGLEAITDAFFVSSPKTEWEHVYDTKDVASFGKAERFEKEKLYDLYDLKAAVEGLDRYFLMRVSGLFPEIKPDFPKADMLMEGSRIIAVIPDGLAGRTGLRAGDVILEMNGIPVAGDIVEIIDSRLVRGNRVMLLVNRNGRIEVVTLQGDPEQPPYQRQPRKPSYTNMTEEEMNAK